MSLTKIVGPSLGVVEVTSLSGNGTPLTSLNASSLLSGTVPVARLSSANSSVGGIVDIVAQTFAGVKTFTSNATFSGSRTFFASGSVLDWNSGDVTITHSTNTLTFGGAASGYIFNDGNVGIGVTPTSILHLRGSAPTLTLDDSGDTITTISYRPQAAGYAERGAVSWNVTTGEMRISAGASGGSFFQSFYTNGTEQVRITSGGNVGIKAAARFYFDGVAGTGDTYIEEYAANEVRLTVGGAAHSAFNATGQFVYYNPPTTASAANAYIAQTDYIRRSTSSIRYKHDIATLDGSDALSAVMAMRPVTYRGKTDADQRRYVGFIAEEMQQWAPLLCTYDDGGESGTPNYVTYDRVTAYLVAVVQRQQKEIDDLKLRLSKRDV